MSGAAGEELSTGGKRTSSPLRLFVDRHEYRSLPLVFFLLIAPSCLTLSTRDWSFRRQARVERRTVSMGGATYIGLSANSWHVMTDSWWDVVLAVFALVGVVTAVAYFSYTTTRYIVRKYRHRKVVLEKLPPPVADFFGQLHQQRLPRGRTIAPEHDAKTIGVYLGSFATPPTPKEAVLLKQWDIVVLDPFQKGLFEAIAAYSPDTSQTVGRLDISQICKLRTSPADGTYVEDLTELMHALRNRFQSPDNKLSPFSAVMLANWQLYFAPIVCHEVIKFIKSLNFDVYLEVSPPDYLTEDEVVHIGLDLVKGLICRNGTILRDGDRRDYYQMANLRRAQRGLAKQLWKGGIVFAMWETIDHMSKLSHSVANRSYLWCRFNTALSWIGSEAALKDAGKAEEETLKGEPLGALMWMKSNETMSVHDIWRLNDRVVPQKHADLLGDVWASLKSFVPDLEKKLQLFPVKRRNSSLQFNSKDETFNWTGNKLHTHLDPLSFSADGENYLGLGCFQTGLPASQDAFNALTEGQRRLRDLNMLDRLKQKDLQAIGEKLRPLRELSMQLAAASGMFEAIEELLDLLAVGTGEETDRVRIYMGIHSGFHRGTNEQFWGLYDSNHERRASYMSFSAGCIDIFISLKCIDRAGAILHTWLSMRQFTRTQCLKAEAMLAEYNRSVSDRWALPPRIVKDIEGLTSEELLLLLQRLSFSTNQDSARLSGAIQKLCRHQLLEIPSRDQLRAQNTELYLKGSITIEEMIRNRIDWYSEHGCHAPNFDAAVQLFKDIDSRVPEMLLKQQVSIFTAVEAVIHKVVRKDWIDPAMDMFALSVFCAFRRLAVDEVYLEILDRNPLPNRHPDQAACFAEMFGTGSQCETYFDMTSNVLGQILAEKYQGYYMKYQPPYRKDGSTELPTSYASKNVDEDPDATRPKLPAYYQITFLGIFAVPALVDILLLTCLGRGLYLSDYMSSDEKTMATAGLMAGLLLCGGIGTWIGYGGSYYLHAMAFPAMNMFVLTRFVAGLSMLSGLGFIGFIIIGAVYNFYAGFIFLFYFVTLNTYLTLLATLSIYQFPGFMFQSGRTTVVMCLPILLISPIITLWVGHENVVYPCVITAFLLSLLYGTREVVAQWGHWYLKVPTISDTDVVKFYTRVTPKEDIPNIADLAATPLPRKVFMEAVLKEYLRKPWQKSEADDLVKTHALGYDSTVFLMDWYCKYSRTATPYPYSPTWNLMVKTAVDTLKDMQKGLKLHNAFIHWRFGGDEVWCGVLYFLIALMDKWVALVSGTQVVGLNNAGSPVFRLAVGFGLGYYLIAAVCLDHVAQPLWPKANKKIPQPVHSIAALKEVALIDAKARRKLYWTNFANFWFSHILGFALTSALMWTFESSRPATIMYMAYVGSYTGLLWYQYNRVYAGPLNMNNLIIAAMFGIIIGPIIRALHPTWPYGSVTALAITTWTACILSWRTADVGWPIFKTKTIVYTKEPAVYSFTSAGAPPAFSQRTLSDAFNFMLNLPSDEIYRVKTASTMGSETLAILRHHESSQKQAYVAAAFPNYNELIAKVSQFWLKGSVIVDLIPDKYLTEDQKKLRSLSKVEKDILHVVVFCVPDKGNGREIKERPMLIASALLVATLMTKLDLSHDHASTAEMLLLENEGDAFPIPSALQRHLDRHSSERLRVAREGHAEGLRLLLLGSDCDIEWDKLPRSARDSLLERCSQQEHAPITAFSLGIQHGKESVARYNLAAKLAYTIQAYAAARSSAYLFEDTTPEQAVTNERFKGGAIPLAVPTSLIGRTLHNVRRVYKAWRFMLKFCVIATTGEPEYQRELDFVISNKPVFIRWPARFILNGFWLYCKTLQRLVIPAMMFHKRENVAAITKAMRGIKTTMKGDRVVTESFQGTLTGFLRTKGIGVTRLFLYSGKHDTQPTGNEKLQSISTYTYTGSVVGGKTLRLTRKEEYANQEMVNAYNYGYGQRSGKDVKLPMARECTHGVNERHIVHYDDRGYITAGSYLQDDNLVMFKYYYRLGATYDDELIRAEFNLKFIKFEVKWCYPPPHRPEDHDRWIPNPKVTEVTYQQGTDRYHCLWNYDHRSHPTIYCTMNGEEIPTPAVIRHDHYHILKKPTHPSFVRDDPLIAFKNVKANLFAQALGFNTKWYPISTAVARNHLWRCWKGTKDLDAVSVRWLDEIALREEPVLRNYWLRRDLGLLRNARTYFQENADAILARTDLDPEVSSWSSIAFKYGDLDSFGQGGDARINTRSVSTQIKDTTEQLHVLAMDTGTWPNEGGGVSACRRDMVNDLSTIRWHVIAENANDYGVPKFQTERNIQSLTVLPLWGMDFLTPNHGVFQDILDSAVQRRSNNTYHHDIREHFFPILTSLVKCARAITFTREHMEESSRALVDLSNYFEKDRHWTETWMSDPVKEKWRELWLAEDVENAVPISQWWDAEKPTLAHLDNALDMWHRFLFIFTLPVPEKIPDVFQASHHFAGASYGVLCKLKRNCTLHVWDHCISWREVTVFLSSAMSFDAPFVCSSLINLSRMTSVLILHHADVVLPCADFFNPGWEIEHGTQYNTIEHRKKYERKIDPVVNGICNMEKFIPIKKIKSTIPTVTMLSHVRFVKDIKNALLAADIIVNQWGFKDYQLDIYGDMEKAPAYSVECKEILASKGLRDHVSLKGLGNPSKVLEEAWIFLNSSISEGLPLAMGEAALTGVPVVCTDVGASFRVVTDPVTWTKFSAVVAPNDSYSLAKAQINVLALLDEWAKYAEDDPNLPTPKLSQFPTKEEIASITARMYAKEDQRRKLGMTGRTNVLNSFSSDRYLREHEQMLWVGKTQSPAYLIRRKKRRTMLAEDRGVNEKQERLGRMGVRGIPLLPNAGRFSAFLGLGARTGSSSQTSGSSEDRSGSSSLGLGGSGSEKQHRESVVEEIV